jgi:hypothetical protein
MFGLRGLDQPWVQECTGSQLKTGPYIHYESTCIETQHTQTVEWYEIGLLRYTTNKMCQEKNRTVMLKWIYLLFMGYPSSSVDSIIRKKFNPGILQKKLM